MNISSYKDRWKERNPDVVLAPYEKEDAPIRAIYGCVSDGILQIGETPPASMPDLLPGQMKVKDLNGFDPNDGSKLLGHPDGKIDAADRIYLGSTDPKVIIGFGNMFEYKNFDLNIFFYGMFGQYVANSNRAKYGALRLRIHLATAKLFERSIGTVDSRQSHEQISIGILQCLLRRR